jgi:cytochrome c nitrite reductase small subunit
MLARTLRSPLALATLAAAVLIGMTAGAGGFTFAYAKGTSYLLDDPSACANCHVMQDVYGAYQRSSHHAVAVCNDCHTPAHFVGKYLAKARNGWHHSVAFTSGDFHEPIQITAGNLAITEARCRSCHSPTVEAIDAHGSAQRSCVRCHRNVGHLH